jgi:predicted FMN-binding regulatory protein PaiB
MYIPAAFRETRPAVLHELIRAYSFGTLVSQVDGELFATHIPFLLDAERGPNGTLVGHMARANPHWHVFNRRPRSADATPGSTDIVPVGFVPAAAPVVAAGVPLGVGDGPASAVAGGARSAAVDGAPPVVAGGALSAAVDGAPPVVARGALSAALDGAPPVVADVVSAGFVDGTARALAGSAPSDAVDGVASALVIFQGPHAYISPSWYATGPAVPTWNYAVVHAHGVPTVIDDPRRVREILDRTVRTFENGRPEPWSTARLTDDYIDNMARGIVAFELPIDRLEGKRKLGQNRPVRDVEGAVSALQAQGDPLGLAIAELMAESATSRAQPRTSS